MGKAKVNKSSPTLFFNKFSNIFKTICDRKLYSYFNYTIISTAFFWNILSPSTGKFHII